MSAYKELSSKEEYEELVNRYDTFLFDCDGVIWEGSDLIPGAKSVMDKLRAKGKDIIFVTNNATKSRKENLKKILDMGIHAEESEIFSSAYAAAVYIKHVLKFPADRKVYVLGMSGIEHELAEEGVQTCGGTDPADNQFLPPLDFSSLQDESAIDPSVGAVLCGFDMHVSYLKLAKAFKHLTRLGAEDEQGPQEGQTGGGCYFLLTNDDSTFPAKGGPWPGAGSLSAPLVFSSKRKPTIIGKPHKPMLDCIVAKKHFDRSKAIMIGDRLDTDIEFAINGGIDSLMVQTGISTKAEIDAKDAKVIPTYLIKSLGDLDIL